MKPIYFFMIALFIALTIIAIVTFFPRRAHETRTIQVLDRELTVLVADSTSERIKGLSGVETTGLAEDGMLFVFGDRAVRNFWMHGMEFDLDVVWIEGNKVVKVDSAIPAPKTGEEPARMSSDPFKVDYVLELPAGKAAYYDLKPGQTIDLR